MILPVRRGGLDRQQKKYPFARRKKRMSRKEGESPRKKEIPLRLSYFAPLREQKSAAADPKCCGTGSKEEEAQRLRPLCGLASLREEKKYLAKKGSRQER